MYQKTTLDNDLRVLTAEMPFTRSVCISIFVGTGSRYETDPEAGISHYIEHILFKGSEKRPSSQEISEAIEGVGGILNGGTDRELTVYWAKVPQNHFPLALDVLSDMLLHPRFDLNDIEKERPVIIEEINMTKDSPSQLVNMLVDELIWPDHPLGRDIAGSRESVTDIDRDAMLAYLGRQYQPGNTVISVTGNIKHQETVDTVSGILGSWPSQPPHRTYSPYHPTKKHSLIIEKKETEQAHICLALPGISLTHPRRFSLDVMNIILGEGMSSRLFSEIRERLGLAYSIHSYVDHFLDTGALTVYAGVETSKLETAVKAIVAQLHRLKDRVSEAELKRAKEFSKGRLLLRMEDSRNVAGWLGGQEILTQRILTPDQIIEILDAVTVDELAEVAGELIDSRQFRLAVVSPKASESRLQKIISS